MKKVFTILTAGLLLSVGHAQVQEAKDPFVKTFIQDRGKLPNDALQTEYRQSDAWKNFKQSHGDWWVEFGEQTGKPHRAFGTPIEVSGATPEQKAMNFITSDLNGFKPETGSLVLTSSHASDKYQFVTYKQQYNGLDVMWSEVTVRLNTAGKVAMFGIDTYSGISISTAPSISEEGIKSFAAADFTITVNSVEVMPALKILPIPGAQAMEFKLVYEVYVHTTDAKNLPGNYYSLVDANTGVVYYRQNRVHACGEAFAMTANVQVNSDISDNPLLALTNHGLPYIKIDIDGDVNYADANGFLTSNTITSPTPATIDLDGLYAKVYQGATGTNMESIDLTLVPGDNTIEFDDASGALASEVSAYYWQNIVHDHMKGYWPTFTDLDFNQLIRVERNDGTCNAFYDGTSTNFYQDGGGCPSTALFNDVVMHEYGHGVNYDLYNWLGDPGGGLNNGAMQEGYADLWAISVTDNPILGQGFLGGAGTFVRRYDLEPKVYPQDLVGEVHADGEIIAGAWWDVEENTSHTFFTDLWNATHNATVDGADGNEGEIYRDVLLEALMADDDNGDLTDGTPNDDAITSAFCEHGITLIGNISIDHAEYVTPVPVLDPVVIDADLVVDYPEYLGPASLFWRTTPGGTYTETVMTNLGGSSYEGIIPGQPQGTIIEYYFKIEDTNGCGGVVLPSKADLAVEPNLPYFVIVGYELEHYEDFDTEFGSWEVDPFGTDDATTGIWDVNTPIPSTDANGYEVQTGEDHTDGASNLCAFTGNAGEFDGVGTNDVDGGMTTIRSPFFDLTDYVDPVFTYYRRYSNASPTSANPGNDVWEVYITDNGTDWTRVERTHTEDNTFRRNTVRVSDFVGITDHVGFIFIAEDSVRTDDASGFLGGSLVEAAVDDLYLWDWAPEDTTQDTTGHVAIEEDMIISGVFPNPANSYMNVFFGNINGNLELSLYNSVGELMLADKVSVTPNYQYAINTAHLPEGIYMLHCVNNGAVSNKRIVVQH